MEIKFIYVKHLEKYLVINSKAIRVSYKMITVLSFMKKPTLRL